MIIVSQNRKILFPFDRPVYVVCDNEFYGAEIAMVDDKELISLGEYGTEERAKEVLQDILKNYQEGTDVYPIPKE